MLAVFLGWILVMLAFVVTQWRFMEAHRNAYGWWRRHYWQPWPPYSWKEIRAVRQAMFNADADQKVERARREYLTAMVVGAIYLVLFIPLAVLAN